MSIESKMYAPDLRQCAVCGTTQPSGGFQAGPRKGEFICRDGGYCARAGVERAARDAANPPAPSREAETQAEREARLKREFETNVAAWAEKARQAGTDRAIAELNRHLRDLEELELAQAADSSTRPDEEAA
jgi:recombinational DNA repair protein (RecF pathway)